MENDPIREMVNKQLRAQGAPLNGAELAKRLQQAEEASGGDSEQFQAEMNRQKQAAITEYQKK